jgi:hypothetical protein
MNAELIGIEVIVAAILWIIAIPAAFYFVGPAVGFVVIVGGLLLAGLWLASVIRNSTEPVDDIARDPEHT